MKTRILIPALLLLAALAGCAGRDALLSRTTVGLNASEKIFAAYDKHEQDEIVTKASSAEAGRAALAEYRVVQTKIKVAFVAAYTAVSLASVDLNDASLQKAFDAGKAVLSALHEIGAIP